MEAAFSIFSSRIISFVILLFASYLVVSLVVHVGLKGAVKSKGVKNGLVSILSVIAFAFIGYAFLNPGRNQEESSLASTPTNVITPVMHSKPPVDWSVQMGVFEKIYRLPDECKVYETTPSMDCSNHRARAVKRFQSRWSDGDFWRNGKVFLNQQAAVYVNVDK